MRYDLHVHTKYSSCSNLSIKKLLKTAYKRGLNGIAVTDHNTIKGALEVKKLNKNKNFEVIIGEEIQTDQGEIIGLYIKKQIAPGKFEDVVRQIKKQNSLVIIPHPYDFGLIRYRVKISIEKIKQNIDAIETFNGRCLFKFINIKSQIKATELDLAQTGGSDAHFAFEIGRAYTEFKGSLRHALKNKTTKTKGSIRLAIPTRILSGILRFIIKPISRIF